MHVASYDVQPLAGDLRESGPTKPPIHPDLKSRYGHECFLETKDERLEITQLVVNEELSGFSEFLYR